MTSDIRHAARAAVALDDELARADPWTVFFSVACRRAIEGRPDDEALTILRDKIDGASLAKLRGEGPPQDEINQVRRLWLDIYERNYARAA